MLNKGYSWGVVLIQLLQNSTELKAMKNELEINEPNLWPTLCAEDA